MRKNNDLSLIKMIRFYNYWVILALIALVVGKERLIVPVEMDTEKWISYVGQYDF